MKTVLVTGACGFSARCLIDRLRREGGTTIVGLDLSESPSRGLDDYYCTDLGHPTAIERVIASIKPDKVFHLAGATQGAPADLYRVNLLGTVHLLEALRLHHQDARILLIGSAAEYGPVFSEGLPVKEEHPCHPVTPYGISKYAMTLAALDYARRGLKVVIARPFNIIGPGMPSTLFLGALIQRIKEALRTENPLIKVGNLDSQRDFLALEDAIEGYIAMLNSDACGEVFNLCSGEAVPMRLLLDELLSLVDRPVQVESDPTLLRASDVSVVFGSYEKARTRFGFRPKKGIQEVIGDAWREATL